jgi:hypothetical protein
MARWTGTTTERGYGSTHQQLRARLLSVFTPGQPCARCGQPMWGPPLDLGHTPDRTAYTGLEHRRCNRGDGARRGNRKRRARRAGPSRPW